MFTNLNLTMKKFHLFLCASLSLTQLSAKSFTKWTQKDFWAPIPSGTLNLNDNGQTKSIEISEFYIFKTEVHNALYSQFEADIKSSDIDLYQKIKRSDEIWKTFFNGKTNIYFTHPAYKDYPALGMSKLGAEEFCKWLEKKINDNIVLVNPKWKGKKVKVDLPTEHEWMYAALGGQSGPYPWTGPYMRNSKGYILANYTVDTDNQQNSTNEPKEQDLTTPVIAYWTNGYGLYNMSGNVKEYVKDAGITKGGSWLSNAEQLKIFAKDIDTNELEGTVDKGFRPLLKFI